MSGTTIVTQEGYDKLVAEHEHLVAVERKEVAERLKEAISYGDISENAEYDSAKNEQAELEDRIVQLEQMIRNAEIIKHEEVANDRVGVGVKVTLKDMDTNEEFTYSIVGSTEADPFEGRISNESAVGKQLLGHALDDVAEIVVPDGTLHYHIIAIEKQ